MPCAGLGQELSVNIAVPPLPDHPLYKFHLCSICWNQSKDTLEKFILWIFQDLPVICPNQTAHEMMYSIEILIKHSSGLIFPSTQGQVNLAEDWELMPQFYLIMNSLA